MRGIDIREIRGQTGETCRQESEIKHLHRENL